MPTKKHVKKTKTTKTLSQKPNINLNRGLLIVLSIALVGGFLVFKSSASSSYAKVWQPGTPDVTFDNKVSIVPKNNGAKAWVIKYPAVPKPDSRGAYAQVMSWSLISTMKLTSPGSGRGTYCAEIANGAKNVGVVLSQEQGVFADGRTSSGQEPKGYQLLPKNGKKDVCVTANLGKPLYLHVIGVNAHAGPENERPETATIIYKLYKQKTQTP